MFARAARAPQSSSALETQIQRSSSSFVKRFCPTSPLSSFPFRLSFRHIQLQQVYYKIRTIGHHCWTAFTKGPTMTKRSILIINPNTTTSMTDNLRPLIDSLGFSEVHPPLAPRLLTKQAHVNDVVDHVLHLLHRPLRRTLHQQRARCRDLHRSLPPCSKVKLRTVRRLLGMLLLPPPPRRRAPKPPARATPAQQARRRHFRSEHSLLPPTAYPTGREIRDREYRQAMGGHPRRRHDIPLRPFGCSAVCALRGDGDDGSEC